MKRLLTILVSTAMVLSAGCGTYDDSGIKSEIDGLKSRVAALEVLCERVNGNVSSLQTLVAAIQKQDAIISVTDLPDKAGYAVLFTSGKTIYLYNGVNGKDGLNGKDGSDGHNPVISVRLDSDGIYYWTLDGEWLIVDGKKVKAVGTDGKDGDDGKDGKDGNDGKDGEDGQDGAAGKDGITPQLKIEEGFWYITYDGGKSWSRLGKAVGEDGKDGKDGKDGVDGEGGENFFKSVTVEDGYAVFVLNDKDQTTIKVPMTGTVASGTISEIKYVPEYADGVARVSYYPRLSDYKDYVFNTLKMNFEVKPQNAVKDIVDNWKTMLSAKAIFSIPVRSANALGEFTALEIKNVTESNGLINVEVALDSLKGDLLASKPYGVSICVSLDNDGQVISSDYVNLKKYRLPEFLYAAKDNAVLSECLNFGVDFGEITSFENRLYNNGRGRLVIHQNCDYPLTISPGVRKNDLVYFESSYPIEVDRISFNECLSLTGLDLSLVDVSNVETLDSAFYRCSSLETLNISGFNTSRVTSMREMFRICSSLKSLNVTNFNTSKVTDMSGMFTGCEKLTTLDVSNFNTSKVTNMSDMFWNCWYLKTLDLSNFDTFNVTDMSYMFLNCRYLTALDVSNFNTSNVTNMYIMFGACTSLTALDVSSFDTSKVTNMSCMFTQCSKLATLDVSNFDTSKVTDMSNMFSNCYKLTTLDVSNFNTSNVTDMSGMFFDCNKLTTLDLSNFNTSNVTDMGFMFKSCRNMTTLDLSNFDMSKVTDVENMFLECNKLKTIRMKNCSSKTRQLIASVKPAGATIVTY